MSFEYIIVLRMYLAIAVCIIVCSMLIIEITEASRLLFISLGIIAIVLLIIFLIPEIKWYVKGLKNSISNNEVVK